MSSSERNSQEFCLSVALTPITRPIATTPLSFGFSDRRHDSLRDRAAIKRPLFHVDAYDGRVRIGRIEPVRSLGFFAFIQRDAERLHGYSSPRGIPLLERLLKRRDKQR